MTALSFNEEIENAKLHARQGDIGKVHALLSKVLVSFAEGARAHLASVEKHRYIPGQENTDLPQAIISELVELYNNEQFTEVIERAEDYLSRYTGSYNLWNIIGAAAARLKQFEKAVIAFRKMIDLVPESPQAYSNLGNALIENDMAYDALLPLQKATELSPESAEAYYLLGNAYCELDQLDEAKAYYAKTLKRDVNHAKALHNMGDVLSRQGMHDEATKAFENALKIDSEFAETHHFLGSLLLNDGRIREGLDHYEWRWKMPTNVSLYRHFSQPVWDGVSSLADKSILIWAEQGIGDTLNWSAFLSLISAQSKHCILECPAKLVPLLSRSFPEVEVRPEDRSRDTDRTDFDVHLPMGSLYRQLLPQITEETQSTAFLTPDPERVSYWKERLRSLGDGPYIGIGWKSSDMSLRRVHNYAPLSEWSPLLTLPNVTFVNLQYKDFEEDLRTIRDEFGVTVHNFEDLDLFDDLDDVAALSAALDIVVSTTCAVPFISAGVGTATKLASWKQSAWSNRLFYPNGSDVEKFERNTWEPWEPVFQTIAANISENFSFLCKELQKWNL